MQHFMYCIAMIAFALAQSIAYSQSGLDEELLQQFDSAIVELIADQAEVNQSFSVLYLREHFSDSPKKLEPEIAGEWGQMARKSHDKILRFDSRLWALKAIGRVDSLPESTLQINEKLFANSPYFGEFKTEKYKRLRDHISDPFGLCLAGSGEHHANKIGDAFITDFFKKGELKSIKSVNGDLVALLQFTKNYCGVVRFGKAVDFRPVDVEGRRVPDGFGQVGFENFQKLSFNYSTNTKWVKCKRFWVPLDIEVHNCMLPNNLEDVWTWRFREWKTGLT